MFLLCCACNTVLIPKAWLNECCWNNYCKKSVNFMHFFFLFALNTTKCWNVQCESVLLSNRLCVLATPDAVVSSPVAQLSIPINGNFEILRGMSSVWIMVSQIFKCLVNFQCIYDTNNYKLLAVSVFSSVRCFWFQSRGCKFTVTKIVSQCCCFKTKFRNAAKLNRVVLQWCD